MRAELAALEARLCERAPSGPAKITGRLGERSFVLHWTGDGAARARGLERALRAVQPSGVHVVGLCGGLDPALAPLDVVEVGAVVDAGGATLHALARGDGVLFSAPEISSQPAEKASRWRAMGSPPRAVVDLETTTYAALVAGTGLPLRVTRVVSDAAHEPIPDVIGASTRADGSVAPLGVALRAALRPRTWRPLTELSRRLGRGADLLADAVLSSRP